MLCSAKDAMVITLSGGGAEVLPFLLPYAVFPSSILFVVVFAWLSVHFSRRTLFNIITIFFTAYFVLFTVCDYDSPQDDPISPAAILDQ